MEGTENDKLLEILAKVRTYKALDEAASENPDYREALMKQNQEFEQLEQAGLDREQKSIVDRAISATNECGAAYGVAAYQLGLHDGVRLTTEIKEIR